MSFPDDWSPFVVVVLIGVAAMIAVAVYLLYRLLRTYRLVRSQLMPLGGKVAFWATLIYLFSPIDVLPDPLMLDDIAVLAAGLTYITRLARSHGLVGPEGDTVRPGPTDADIIDVPWTDDP